MNAFKLGFIGTGVMGESIIGGILDKKALQPSQVFLYDIDTAKRITARGGDVVVLIDGLDALAPHLARRALAAARNVVDGGSLTIVATASEPVGGETTIIALDRTLTQTRRFPAIDLVASGTIRPELLVGDAGADAIAQARAQALGA